jgi:Holliday junction DNA helicase RuvA
LVAEPPAPAGEAVVEDAVSALVNLGYGRTDAFAAVSRVLGGLSGTATVQGVIGLALKDLGKGL